MAARSGMTNMITRLRAMTNAGSTDAAYTTDDELQDVLEQTRVIARGMKLQSVTARIAGGGLEFKEYLIPGLAEHFWIEEAGTDSPFAVRDGTFTVIANSSYAINYQARTVTFTADQQNAPRYVDFNAYNLNLAALRIWEAKAAELAASFNTSTDGQNLQVSQQYDHSMDMVKLYRRKAGIRTGKFSRTDENPSPKPLGG